ncbi:hypothetical protein PB1_10384 [Bacillus methanolicus PB1]|uniref:Uncharacterized protein n=1 Tax=Bacillus methanolicus PB1 TaxID=997296 RepID=I3DUQ0_BACMT|nr:hypothetical protein PB1_10384 [Bacillus methanolicus PB1]
MFEIWLQTKVEINLSLNGKNTKKGIANKPRTIFKFYQLFFCVKLVLERM